jgi:hypothetical protein
MSLHLSSLCARLPWFGHANTCPPCSIFGSISCVRLDLLHSVRSMSAYCSVKPQQGCVVRPMPKNTPQNARWIGGSFPKMLFETNDTRLRRCGFTPVLLRSNKPVFRLQAERTFCDQSIVGDAEALIRCSGYHDRDRNHYNEVNLSPLSPVVSHQSLLPSEL